MPCTAAVSPGFGELVRETRLAPQNLILPLFARPGHGEKRPIGSMSGHFQLSPEMIAEEAAQAVKLGLGGILLFGIPAEKDVQGSDACSDDGIVPQAIRGQTGGPWAVGHDRCLFL